jgi:hypothetical protein
MPAFRRNLLPSSSSFRSEKKKYLNPSSLGNCITYPFIFFKIFHNRIPLVQTMEHVHLLQRSYGALRTLQASVRSEGERSLHGNLTTDKRTCRFTCSASQETSGTRRSITLFTRCRHKLPLWCRQTRFTFSHLTPFTSALILWALRFSRRRGEYNAAPCGLADV